MRGRLFAGRISGLLFWITLLIAGLAYADDVKACDAGGMLKLLSTNLKNYEVVQKRLLSGSSEGVSVGYYYSGVTLKAVKSVYYNESNMTEIQYFFRGPSDYASRITEYYYTVPVYMDGSEVAATNESTFVVCGGALMRGIGDDAVVVHYERVNNALKKILDTAPRR